MRKQIWEITESDLKEHPVWVFPMVEDEGADEATVQPASETEVADPDTQVIVASKFFDNSGNQYFGYMYWSKPALLEDNQPLLWLKGVPTSLWYGMRKPSKEELSEIEFPLKGETVSLGMLEPIELDIEGYGYFHENRVIYVNS